MSIVDAITCQYVWFNILRFVGNADRISVALTCRTFARLALWVDPIFALHKYSMHMEDAQLANSMIDNSDLLEFDGREKLDQYSFVQLLYRTCHYDGFESLHRSLLAHTKFDSYMLSLFRDAPKECYVIARRLLTDRDVLHHLLNKWSGNQPTLVLDTRPALENMCKIASQYRFKGAVGYMLSVGYELGRMQVPEEPMDSHSFQIMCSWLLIGACRQQSVTWFQKIANLPIIGLSGATVLTCFDNAMSFQSWSVLEHMLEIQQPFHRQFLFHRLLGAFQGQMTSNWVHFARAFLNIDENGDTLTDQVCYNFVRHAFIECINQAENQADTFDLCCNTACDAIILLLRRRALHGSYIVAFETLRLVCIFASSESGFYALDDFVHNLFHEMQPFLSFAQIDWRLSVGNIDLLTNSVSPVASCIVEWVEKRQQEAEEGEQKGEHVFKRRRI